MLLLDQLTALLGGTRHVPRVLFPHPWVSKAGKTALALHSLFSLGAATLAPRRMIMICGTGPSLLEGEVIVADGLLPARALACVRARRPFVALPTHADPAVAYACKSLGIDAQIELRAYLSLNALLIIFGEQDGRPVVVHVAVPPAGSQTLARHRMGLHIAAAASLSPDVRDLVPKSIDSRKLGSLEVLVQSRQPGKVRRYAGASNSDLYADIERGLAVLLGLRTSAEQTENGPDHTLLHEDMPRDLTACAELKDMLWPVLLHVQAWQRRRGLPSMLTHGDFWTRNVLFDETGTISGIVDWERARARGTPGLDALHLAMMSLAMERGYDIIHYIRQAWTGEWESDRLALYVATVRTAFGLERQDIECLAGFLLLDEIHKLISGGRRLSPARRARFVSLAPAIREWLSAPSGSTAT